MDAVQERRRSARQGSDEPLAFNSLGPLAGREEDFPRAGRCVDVSADEQGIGFVTHWPVYTGKRMRILRGDAAATGEVRWVRTAAVGYRVGVAMR